MSADGVDDPVRAGIKLLCRDADRLFAEGAHAHALALWSAAWELVPEPRCAWPGAGEILVALGDCHLQLDQDEKALEAYSVARDVPGYQDQQLLRLRLGMVCYELNLLDRAAEEFHRAEQLHDVRCTAGGDPEFADVVDRKVKLWPTMR